MDLTQITELYAAVYDQDLREEVLSVEEDFEFVDGLSDNDLDRIMESILEEGEVTLSECAYAFDGALLQEQTILSEARPTPRSQAERAQRRSERAGEREASVAAKRKEDRIARVKSAVDRAKTRVTGAVDKVKTRGAGAVSAVAGGAAELGRKAKSGAEKLSGKLKSAKEKIKGFVGRVGRAAKAAKSELSGEAGRQSNLRRDFRKNVRSARARERAAAGSDTSKFERPSSTSGPYRGIGGGKKIEVASSGTQSKPSSSSYDLSSERRKKAAAKATSAERGTRGGVRFAGPKAGQATNKLMRSGSSDVEARYNKATAFAKKAGLSEEFVYILEQIMEDLIQEGYADTYEDALYIIESLDDNEADELIESYLTEETYDVYDVILEYLCTEGYADTLENAETIMVNMSEDWRDTILDEATSNLTKPKAGDVVPYHIRTQIQATQNPDSSENQEKAANRAKRKKKRLEFEVR